MVICLYSDLNCGERVKRLISFLVSKILVLGTLMRSGYNIIAIVVIVCLCNKKIYKSKATILLDIECMVAILSTTVN